MAVSVHGRRVFIAAALGFVAVVAGAVGVALFNGSRHRQPVDIRRQRALRSEVRAGPAVGWTEVSPVTVKPEESPVQQQYDRALAQGLAGSGSISAAEAASSPTPAVSASWPALPVSDDPDQWTRAFVQELLGIDFTHQSRAGLGRWLAAEEAPELLPGIPPSIQHKVLYLSLFDTSAVGGVSTPIPSADQWDANARAAVVWSLGDLVIAPNARWSQIIAEGWQPLDERFAVEDVSGTLTIIQGPSVTSHRFSMTMYLGSAHWHEGYGTVLVNSWQAN